VLASDEPEGGLQRTPADSPVKSSARLSIDGKFTDFGALDATLEYTAEGDRDFPMRAGFRRVPQGRWKDFARILSTGWGFPGEVDQVQVDSIEDTSKPFHLKYHLHTDRYFTVPSTSANFRPIPPLGVRAVTSSTKSKEPIEIGPAGTMDYRIRLEFPSNFSVSTPTAVKMARDYGEYSSTYSLTKGVLEGERKLNVKLNELPASRRADYDSFRNVTRSDENQVLTATIMTPSGKNAESASAKIEGTPSELHRAGVKALQSKDYRSATDLLKRAVDGDTNLKEGWYDLGQAYAGVNNHADAIAAFRKQIELDPNHKSANGDLAMELQQSGKSEEALAAYRKQLEIVPFDKSTHKNLGMLLAQLGRDADARMELETAVSIPPDDPETRLSLAQVYTRLDEKVKAQDLLKGLTGSTAGDSGEDIFAAALAPGIDPAQTENDARQVLYDIGEQFDSGNYDRLGPSAFSAMRLVALAWSRIGWAKFLRGESLEAMQFLNSAWLLSQSGTVANRLGQVLEKQGQREKARQMYGLAAAAGGSVVADSRERLGKLGPVPDSDDKDPGATLIRLRTVALGSIAPKASAHFNLVFDGSPRPERAEFIDGDESLRSAAAQLREKDFPVKFPDASSVKIVRRGQLTCGASGCGIELLPLDTAQSTGSTAAATNK
jgi:tetratricopeptide (TPR) repeat protein